MMVACEGSSGGWRRLTWQPEPGLRMAVVARQAPGGVVVAGQSLTPFEDSDRMSQLFLAAGWVGSMAVLAGAYGAVTLASRRRPSITALP